jgi:DNA-binding NarL/FixJ family response regulator
MTGDAAATPIRILLVDDQALVRRGFRMILEIEPGLEVVAEAQDGLEAIDAAARVRPDVVVMDIHMPKLDGIESMRRMHEALDPAPRVLVVTTFDDDERLEGALRAGASGYLLKNAPPEQLVDAVRAVASGDGLLSPQVTRRVIAGFTTGAAPSAGRADLQVRLDDLTEREREVLQLVATGLSNAEIAARLFVSTGTVKTHVARILTKLGLRDRIQAVIFAYDVGLARPNA